MQKVQPRKAEKVKRDPPGGLVPAEIDDFGADEPSELDQLLPREALFVAAVATGMSGKAAAIAAGYAESDAYSRSHRLLRRPRVASALAELEMGAAAAAGVTRRGLLERLLALADDPEAHPSARVRALEVLARHMGMLTERLQIEATTTVYTLMLGGDLNADDELDELEVAERVIPADYDGAYGCGPASAGVGHDLEGPAPVVPSPAELAAPVITTGVSYYERRPSNEAEQRSYLDSHGWR